MRIAELSPDEAAAQVEALTDLLADAVDSGASVSFMQSTPRDTLAAFWIRTAGEVRERGTRMLAAVDGERLIGVVLLRLTTPPNQPHRADVAKLLVHRSARRRGVAKALMTNLERLARDADRTLLTLDTVTGGAAEPLYAALGWTRVGIIPGYALFPDGRPCDTTVFFKRLD